MKSIIKYAVPAALLASLPSCASQPGGDFLSINADTARKVVEVKYTSACNPGICQTVEYGNLPVVFSDFQASCEDTAGAQALRIEANFALGFLSSDALTRKQYEDSCINSISDPFGEESQCYPNYIVKAWADALPQIPGLDWANVRIEKSVAKKRLRDEFTRISGGRIKYTASEDGKVFFSKEFTDTAAAHQPAPEVERMKAYTGTENSEIYTCEGDVDIFLYEDLITPLSKLYKAAFLCCPDRFDEKNSFSHIDLGFADVYIIDIFRYMCGAHGLSSRDASNILKNGDNLDLYDIVRKDMEPALAADLYERYGEEYGLFEKTFPLGKVRLASDGLIFFWSEYEIGPYVSGFCDMELKYKEGEKYLTPKFAAVLKEAGKL